MHAGIVGRKVGSALGYRYSNALKNADFVWDERRLYVWLQNPRKMVPGTRMGTRIGKDQDRKDLIAYLATLKSEDTPMAK